jgi:hypothetical protein
MRTSTKWFVAAGLSVVLIGVVQLLASAQGGVSNSAVVGVWRVSEVTTTGPNGRKITNPQPSVRIFTERYFSVTDVTSDTPRAELPLPAEKRTDKQIADAYGPFSANAGTYEIKGNEITFKRIAAKNPAVMRSGNFATSTFRLEGKDTLWLTGNANDAGPVANPQTVKLTRLE